MKEAIVAGLIKGRHPLPVEQYVYESIENPMDFESMQLAAVALVWGMTEARAEGKEGKQDADI